MGYDKNGNMTSRQRSSIGDPVGENTNMEVSIGTMQSNPGSESVAETFSYNSLNQMTGYQNSNGTNATYTYDATGMRTSKTVNGVEKKFYYNGMYILNEGDSAEINVTNFVGLTGIEGRQNGANEMAYFMKDAHGDVIKAMDSEDFRADYEYDIWGNQTQEATNTFDNPFRYCSEYMDEESGLIYLRARYYDSNTGRFTQKDPAMDGLNWYTYAGNNPIAFFDPKGLKITLQGINNFQDPRISAIEELSADIFIPDYETGELDRYEVDDVQNKQVGTSLIRELMDSDVNIIIILDFSFQNGEAQPFYNADGSLNKIVIRYNPDYSPYKDVRALDEKGNVLDKTITTRIPNYIVLGHELVHSIRRVKGIPHLLLEGKYIYKDSDGRQYFAGGAVEDIETIGISYILPFYDKDNYLIMLNVVDARLLPYTENALLMEHGIGPKVIQ